MEQEEVVAWLCAQSLAVLKSSATMGEIEKVLDHVSKECRRMALERLTQKSADRQALVCPDCQRALKVEAHRRPRAVDTYFGAIRFHRSYGTCPTCRTSRYPADESLGLQPRATASLIIELDAWNIRERDHWGKTQRLRKAGTDPGRWHWVYTGTVFRLDQRATTESGRPVISERGFVATRQGIESFQRQLYAEALQRGMTKAARVLVLADGAVWIWNIVADRFKQADQRVDLYHVKGHLWDLANELFGHSSAQAKEWVTPFLNWLTRRTNGALDVIEGLEGMRTRLQEFSTVQKASLEREIGYFQNHQHRMDYKAGKKLGQPLGSGAIESTCSQYQRRFKLTGQFWSIEGDEAFLALATLHRNERWSQIFPHDDT